jgi:glycosyltransferase involved in cell wall biosynthesis
MACGLPVVATTAGGLPEIVDHGRTGLLVSPGDSEALAWALHELLAYPDRRRGMGEAGRRVAVERFGLERMLDETADLYRELLARRRLAVASE